MLHISFTPEILGHIAGFPVANSLLLSLTTAVLLVGGGVFAVRALSLVPDRVQGFAESVVESILGFMAQVVGSREQAQRFFPLVASVFLFILLNNWLGVLPGIGSLGVEEHGEFLPLFRSANSDLNTTLALALVSVLAIQLTGIRNLGVVSHAAKYIDLRSPLQLFVGLLELVGEFAKVLSFSFRLFGNIFAGEVLLLIVMFLVPFLAPFPFLLLEFFVGFIQALVFAVLTLIFLNVAVQPAEH